MPKMKTKSAAKKRFKKLKSGLIKHEQVGKRHILTKKSSKRKRQLRTEKYVKSCDMRHFRVLLPY